MSEKRRNDASLLFRRPVGDPVRIEFYRAEQWPTQDALPNSFRIRLDGRWWPEAATSMDAFHFASPYGVGQLVAELLATSFGIPTGRPGNEESPVKRGEAVKVVTSGGYMRTFALGDAARDPDTLEWMVRVSGVQAPVRVDSLLPVTGNDPRPLPSTMTICGTCNHIEGGSLSGTPCVKCGAPMAITIATNSIADLFEAERTLDAIRKADSFDEVQDILTEGCTA